MKNVNISRLTEDVISISHQAGKLLKKYFQQENLVIHKKDAFDFATEADIQVDTLLRNGLAKLLPAAKLLTEETAPSDYSVLKNEELSWVVDPLDGTWNFSRRNWNFAVSIALVSYAKPLLGVAYVPMMDCMYVAHSQSQHAFCNNRVIHVSQAKTFAEAILAADWGHDHSKRASLARTMESLAPVVKQIKVMGSAVADLASLASGQIDGYIHPSLKPWDVAAVALIIEKAGGKITRPDGGEWNIFEPSILATNGLLHSSILEKIKA